MTASLRTVAALTAIALHLAEGVRGREARAAVDIAIDITITTIMGVLATAATGVIVEATAEDTMTATDLAKLTRGKE